LFCEIWLYTVEVLNVHTTFIAYPFKDKRHVFTQDKHGNRLRLNAQIVSKDKYRENWYVLAALRSSALRAPIFLGSITRKTSHKQDILMRLKKIENFRINQPADIACI